jgi:hypothetical protein
MKKLFMVLSFLVMTSLGYSQICPTPSTNGVFVTLDETYQLAPASAGSTEVGLCFYNNTTELITAVQFRVFYDTDAFTSVSSVVSSNTSFSQYIQFQDSPANGYVTITLTYTGNDSNFELSNGSLVKLNLTHTSNFASLSSVDPMTFSGVQTFPQVSTTQAGLDYVLNLQNFGGTFLPQLFSFSGTFTNVTGTGSKQIPVILEKKLMTSSTWVQASTTQTNNDGIFTFTDVPLDVTSYDVRIRVDGESLSIANIISTSDSQKINRFVLGQDTPTGFDFYSSDVNGDNNISISDVYGVFGRVSGRFNSWPNSVKDIKFFTSSEYSSINTSSTSLQSSIPGVTNLIYNILPGTTTVTFYVLVKGDANGTGFNMARMTPIEIVNPLNTPSHIIDVTTSYDDSSLQTIELNYPNLTVNENNLVEVPVTVKTNGIDLGSLQFALNFNGDLLDFKGVIVEPKVGYWITYLNPNDNIVEWGGYDPTLNTKLLNNNDLAFTLQFTAKEIQSEWMSSPLYVTKKFAGNSTSKDLNIIPTNGMVQILRVVKPDELEYMVTYPNPTDSFITVKFTVEKSGDISLSLYDLGGRQIKTIVHTDLERGEHNYSTNIGYLPSGTYVVVLKKDNGNQFNKVIRK